MPDNMPLSFPSTRDFSASQVSQQDNEHHWQRSPGQGGRNYGKDFTIPSGTVLVGWNVLEHSRIRLDGQPAQNVVMEARGRTNVPKGVHVGCRLEPQGRGGSGASYKFTVQMRFVTEDDWYAFLRRSFTEDDSNNLFIQSEADPEIPEEATYSE